MSIDFIPPVLPINVDSLAATAAQPTASSVSPAAEGPNFGQLVSQGLQTVNQQLQTSQVDLQRLASGEVENLHQVMLRLEQSRLSFQLMLQVRNRLLESYQEVMRMQV
jgi:flagellar hook-basal body complex protein FliE